MFQSIRTTFFPLRLLSRLSFIVCLSTFSVCTLFLSVSSAFADTRPTVVCYENLDYVPFMLGEKDIPKHRPGILLELIAVAAPTVDIQYQRKPWKRCIKQLQLGKVDGMFAAIWLPERDSWGQFPPRGKPSGIPADSRYRLWHVQYQIFVNHTSSLTWDGQNFQGLSRGGVSAPAGYVARKKLKEMGVLAGGNHVALEGFKLVALDRLDGYVVEKHIGMRTVFRLPRALQDRISFLQPPLFNADWHIVFSHQYMEHYADTAQKIWDGLANVTKTERKAIIQRYEDAYDPMP